MNKKLALFLTVVIFAGIAFCFFRPVDSEGFVTYGEFGNIKSVYVEGYWDIPFTVSGETDLLTVTRLAFKGQSSTLIYFQVAEGRQFSMGSVDVNFTVNPWDDGTPFDLATVEHLEDGKWVHYDDINNFSYAMPAIKYTTSPRVLSGEYNYAEPIFLPLTDPGRYRVTFNFREVFGDRDRGFTCDETVHHISIEYEVPAASERRYDILSFIVRPEPFYEEYQIMDFAIRANDGGEAPFRKYSEVDVEMRSGGEWVSVETPPTADHQKDYYQRNSFFEPYFAEYQLILYAFEPNSDYRVTLYFAEEDQGTDYMPLRIHIRTADR